MAHFPFTFTRLYTNQIGDEGVRHLADALERGAAPELVSKHINLGSNPATNTEVAAFVCKHRYQPTQLLDGAFLVERCASAKALACGNLGWGDEEARRLAAAIEHAHANDALQALVTLDLSLNKIGDDGLRQLGDAVSHGAAPALKTLLLSGNAASDAARQAVEDALKLRS